MTVAPLIRYVAYVRAVDRPGSLTAVAEVVSSRGVSIEALDTGDFREGTALMTLLFSTSQRLLGVLQRTLERLEVVSSVRILPADDPHVLAAGVVHAHQSVNFRPPEGAAVAWSGDTAAGQPLLVEGPLVEVEKVLDAARALGVSRVRSVLLPL